MRRTFTLLLVTGLTVSACGFADSRVNPFNWFGRSQSVPVETGGNDNPLIPTRSGLFSSGRSQETVYPGSPFEQITDLTVERVPGGAIVRATGLADRQGYYNVQLTPQNEEETPVDGVLTYRLEAVRPARATAVGTQPTREVIAGRKITDQQLRDVRTIRVEGVRNARVARR